MSFLKSLADIVPGLGKLTYDDSLGTVFITSGTGVLGYRVAMSLLDIGACKVRVGIWKGERTAGPGVTAPTVDNFPDQVSALLKSKGAEIIDFDWSNPDGFEKAVAGVKTVFCTIPHMDHWSDVFPAFLRTCKQKKIEHFVKVSFLRNTSTGEKYRSNVPFVQFHSTCDDLLEQSKHDSRISFTILACSHLMSTPILHQGKLLTEEHKFVTASYGMGVNYVSPIDVADSALVVLFRNAEHRNKTYNLTGRRAIPDAEVAKLLSKKYDADIQHIQLGYHAYKADVKARGLPGWLVKDSAEFERMKASGIDELPSSYTKDLELLLGRKPQTFEEYLRQTTNETSGGGDISGLFGNVRGLKKKPDLPNFAPHADS